MEHERSLIPRGSAVNIRVTCLMLALAMLLPGHARADEDQVDLGRGPVPVFVPSSYDESNPAPLVLLLHGWLWNGQLQEDYFDFLPQAEAYGCIYAYPDGSVGPDGINFWNATDACCDFNDTEIDDAGYLAQLIDAISTKWNVDQRRIWIIGHSNGGFMAHRMACEYPDKIAAIVSFAGAAWKDPDQCTNASNPVHVLGIHGTLDLSILYGGGSWFGNEYPGAVETVEQWAQRNGCLVQGEQLDENLNLSSGVFGSETSVTRYVNGCNPGGSCELWTMSLSSHYPLLNDQFAPLVFEYLFAHPKPAPCHGDLTGDLGVDGQDIAVLLAAWGACGPRSCIADLDESGLVDGADLAILLAGWGDCR